MQVCIRTPAPVSLLAILKTLRVFDPMLVGIVDRD
jgi:hypothetical protein